MTDPLLTASDVAALCQVSPKTVMRAIKSGDLRAARLGKRGAFRISRVFERGRLRL
jgi:excisionase family DNA binding protein